MAEVWVTALGVVGTAVSVAGTVASLAASPGSAPAVPKFKKIDTAKVQQQAVATDQASYALSDINYKKRFPDLVKARDYMRGDIVANMAGAVSPVVTSAMKDAGLGGLGGARLGNNPFAQARALGRPILSLQNRGRRYFANEVGMNPERQFGLTGQDVAHIAIANTGGANNFNQGLFGVRMGQYQNQVQQGANIDQGLIAGLGGIVRAGAQLYNDSNSLDPNYYRTLGGSNFSYSPRAPSNLDPGI